jgi:carbonic anhydrase
VWLGEALERWLVPLRALRERHREELDKLPEGEKREMRLAELNVEAGVRVVEGSVVDLRHLVVLGAIYDVRTGKLRFLGENEEG